MAKKILIVEDEADIQSLVKEVLGKSYKILVASSGKEALAKLKKESPDLVLVDMFMPEMSGRELCEKIREDKKLKNLKLAFLTVAQFSTEGRKELKRLGILDYIQKPFDNEDLVKRVKKMLG